MSSFDQNNDNNSMAMSSGMTMDLDIDATFHPDRNLPDPFSYEHAAIVRDEQDIDIDETFHPDRNQQYLEDPFSYEHAAIVRDEQDIDIDETFHPGRSHPGVVNPLSYEEDKVLAITQRKEPSHKTQFIFNHEDSVSNKNAAMSRKEHGMRPPTRSEPSEAYWKAVAKQESLSLCGGCGTYTTTQDDDDDTSSLASLSVSEDSNEGMEADPKTTRNDSSKTKKNKSSLRSWSFNLDLLLRKSRRQQQQQRKSTPAL